MWPAGPGREAPAEPDPAEETADVDPGRGVDPVEKTPAAGRQRGAT